MSLVSIEECELLSDSKYRAYISQVEKALKSFEYTSEWADLISALGKLNKVLVSHVKYPVIPRRVTIGKRLAQCLHPALPSGVHLKVLETYDIIFKCIGTQRLSSDLFTYGAGLFPLLSYAAINVKPILLSIYETHFVPLGRHIKPALSGVLLGLLPGLEEGSEFYARVSRILDDFCEAVEATHFYGCLWECVVTCSNIRLSAISFVLAHYKRKLTMEDQLYIIGTNIDTMVEALCSSVQDSSVLVQRSALELLLAGFPVHNNHLNRPDMEKVMCAVVKVVLRRDMSLNRRLYAWLLGTDSSGMPITNHMAPSSDNAAAMDNVSICSETELAYFNLYSKDMLVQGIRDCIQESSGSNEVTDGKPASLRPFRILISLLDRPEIGPCLLEDVLLDVFKHMYRECVDPTEHQPQGDLGSYPMNVQNVDKKRKHDDRVFKTEIIKTANLLFGAFEPYFIWEFIANTFANVCAQSHCSENGSRRRRLDSKSSQTSRNQVEEIDIELEELCFLVEFLLDKLTLEAYAETQTEHLPELLRRVTTSLAAHCAHLSDSEINTCLQLCARILSRVLPSMTPVVQKQHSLDGLSGDGVYDNGVCLAQEAFNYSFTCPPSQLYTEITQPVEGVTSSESSVDKPAMSDAFGEFVQYTDTDDRSFKTAANQPKHTLMQACVTSFQDLFVQLIETHIIGDQSHCASILVKQLDIEPIKSQGLPKGLRKLLYHQDYPNHSNNRAHTPSNDRMLTIGTLSKPVHKAFLSACQLLVDFSCFPMCCTETPKPSNNNSKDCDALPRWLEMLLVCCCFVDNFELQHTAITTMLDLINLTQSVTNENDSSDNHNDNDADDNDVPRSSTRTVSVVIVPSLSQHHLYYLQKQTNFYKVVASCLWHYLGDSTPAHHQACVELLYQLHQVTPDAWTCEDVIGNSLLSDNKAVRVDAHKRFAVLWHLLREKRYSTSLENNVRTFDRSLCVVLDSLQSDINHCRSLTQTWLTHAIQRGDIARIMEPMLLVLLHPDTARISIQHVRLDKSRTISTSSQSAADRDAIDSDETNIYAISSDKGNVVYHVSNSTPMKSKVPENKDPTFAVTSIGNVNGTMTKHTKKRVENVLPCDQVDPGDVTVRLNPFGATARSDSMDSLIFDADHFNKKAADAALQNATRLDSQTCRKEGIYFDDVEQAEEADEKQSDSEGGPGEPDDSRGDASLGDGSNHTVPEKEIMNGELNGDAKVNGEVEAHMENNLKEESYEYNANIKKDIIKDGIINDQDAEKLKWQEKVKKKKRAEAERIATRIIMDLINEIVQIEPEPVVLQGSFLESESTETLNDDAASSNSGNNDEKIDVHDDVDSAIKQKANSPQHKQIVTFRSDSRDADLDNISLYAGRGPEISPVACNVHPLHTHVLLYTQKYDTERTLYAFSVIKAVLSSAPRLVTCALSTTNISAVSTPHLLHFQNLLLRHRRSVFGKNFFSEIPYESMSSNKSSMFLEVVVSVCLYFIRSYYPDLMAAKLSKVELSENKQVQIQSCDLLTLLLSELVNIARDSGKSFSVYVGDLFSRCKVQKALLHCLLASVHNTRSKSRSHARESSNPDYVLRDVTEAIVNFNEDRMDRHTSDSFQAKLLKLVLVLIILEEQIRVAKNEAEIVVQPGMAGVDMDKMRMPAVRFIANRPIVTQSMFLCSVLSALKQHHRTDMHRHWLTMVTTAMPYVGRSLANILVPVINQLCKNIEIIAELYELDNFNPAGSSTPSNIPADHITTMFESLTTISQYCLLDSNQQDISVGPAIPPNPQNIVNDTVNSSKIVYNLIHVLNPYTSSRESTPDKDSSLNMPSPIVEARRSLLSILPRILASLAVLWKAINVSDQRKKFTGKDQACWALGTPKVIKQCMMELLSPISLHHGTNMLAAVAIVWNDRRKRHSNIKSVVPPACADQLLLVDLVSAVRVLPIDTLIQTVKQVIKQPPPTTPDKHKKRVPIEVSMLQFFYLYIQRSYTQQTVDSWPALHSLLKDGLQLGLPAPGQFLLLAIFNEFVHKTPAFEDKKDQKDVQDICQKLLEACSEIARSSLEQTTWLRRHLEVKPGPQLPVGNQDEPTTDHDTDAGAISEDDRTVPQHSGSGPQHSGSGSHKPSLSISDLSETLYRQYSVQALMMLAQLVAPLLDVVYSSDEKDKVLPLLTTIMHHVFPYLRNHSSHNLPSFRACCQLLASLSGYQYTRKTWRRDAFELLIEPSFFQVDAECLSYWRVIIDNLMTHDKTTFKDLIAKVTVVPSGSLNLFSSRDQEIEQRAQLLKRLSFVIYSSEVDQYHKSMPDVQERLVDNLRVPQVPTIQAHVFLCFRVLILRMSPQQLTSLWPTMITELVHVLLQMEQELVDIEETNLLQKKLNRSQLARLGNLDASWAFSNGMSTRNNPSWLRLYLSACKLLDLALVLPQNLLPQFQLYRWAFMGDPGFEDDSIPIHPHREYNPKFTPHVLRICKVMNKKYGTNTKLLHRIPGCPLINLRHIRTLQDLHPFFDLLATEIHNTMLADPEPMEHTFPKSISMPEGLLASGLTNGYGPTPEITHKKPREYIDELIQNDFIEMLPKM